MSPHLGCLAISTSVTQPQAEWGVGRQWGCSAIMQQLNSSVLAAWAGFQPQPCASTGCIMPRGRRRVRDDGAAWGMPHSEACKMLQHKAALLGGYSSDWDRYATPDVSSVKQVNPT